MKTQAYILNDRAQALAHYPHARRVGELIFVSGVSSRRADNSFAGVTIDEAGVVSRDIAVQTQAVLENIRIILQEAGADLEHVVDVSTFLLSMDDFSGYNAIYNRYFDAASGPTRTTVAVYQLPHPHISIEMKVVARTP
ncbi:MAG: RidA family protein [Bradymonadaceae bacterium]|nr:RidA family protein [Lujinxingiaceae bacterium]